MTAPKRVDVLISEANKLTHDLEAARDEAVRLGADAFANPEALQRANERLAWLQGVADGWVTAGWAEYRKLRRGD